MAFTQDYSTALAGLVVIVSTWMLQWLIASRTKASQPGAIPGKIDENLSHESFVYRSHRTFHNSQENLPMMMATSFLALFLGANPQWVGYLIWTFAIARILHMALYYKIATEKNPSPRTLLFAIGFFANVALIGLCIGAAF